MSNKYFFRAKIYDESHFLRLFCLDMEAKKADKGAVIYTDGFKTYGVLADYSYKKHYRVKHGENEIATKRSYQRN